MLPFLHARLQQLDAALTAGTALWQLYRLRDPALEAALGDWLTDTAASLKRLSLTAAENECASLQGQWAAAREHIDPFRREVVDTQRRALRRVVALHVMETLGARLRELRAQAEAALQRTREPIQALVLAALQRGLIDAAVLGSPDQAALDGLWRRIRAEPDFANAAHGVAISLALPDVLLLLDESLAALRA